MSTDIMAVLIICGVVWMMTSVWLTGTVWLPFLTLMALVLGWALGYLSARKM
jgi:hypothetical protein